MYVRTLMKYCRPTLNFATKLVKFNSFAPSKRSQRASFALILGIFFALTGSKVFAQEVSTPEEQESETLEVPMALPSTNGVYEELSKIPEDVRRSKIFARGLNDLKRHAGTNGVYDKEARMQAVEQSRQDLYRASVAAEKSSAGKYGILANAWTNIGPNVIGSYTIGGCTNALAIDPKTPSIMYAGAAGGGVWKTSNSGGSWFPLTDLVIPDLAVASIAIDPVNTNNIYVGSGDGYSSTDALNGTGLYKSSDAGSTWTRIGASTFTSGVVKVFVHPSKTNIIFASGFNAAQGLYRSINSGVTWSKVYTSGGVVWDIVPGLVIGGVTVMYLLDGNNFSGPSQNCGVYKSADDGATWGKLANVGIPRGDSIGRGALACPKGNPSKVYALLSKASNSTGDLLGLYKSVNSGTSFAKVSVPSTLFRPTTQSGAQGWYDLYLGMSPNAATHDSLYVGGVEGWYNWDDGGGWVQFSGYNNSSNSDPHVDHHSIALNPFDPTKIFVGTDGGIFYSNDAGNSWVTKNNGYSTMRFYHLSLDKNDSKTTYAGAQDQGTWKTVTGITPKMIYGGDGFQPISDYVNASTIYAELPFGNIYRTANGGTSWTNTLTGSIEQGDWDCPYQMAPKNHSVLYTGRTKVFLSSDQGNNWTAISPVLNSSNQCQSIGLSPSNGLVIWAGFGTGVIKLTTDGGTTWASKNTNVPGASINYFACHPTNASWAIIGIGSGSTSSSRVMLTSDGGTTWVNRSGTGTAILPGVPVNGVALDSVNPASTWYAATDNGIYYTLDAGLTWSIAGSGLGLAACMDVQMHPNKTTIRVATHGRGIWEGNANALPVELDGLKATPTSAGTRLDWHTDSEKNNLRFEVMRSYNSQPFEVIGSVPSQASGGNSNMPISYVFVDPKHDNGDYLFQLRQVDLNGTEHFSNHVELHYGAQAFGMDQNYPNPFVLGSPEAPASTRIHYSLPNATTVSIKVYSTSGMLVRTLLDRVGQDGGAQDAFWDGTDSDNRRVSSGTYYYILETSDGGHLTNKMVVLQ
jgi:photosystem II stability/assembly factor-like uncharacterized protein